MDSSLLIILVIAPGMIGIAVSCLFNGNSKPPGISNSLIEYFLFSVTSWVLAELLFPGYVMSKVLQGYTLSTLDLLKPMFFAIIIGAMWSLGLKKLILWFVNLINKICGKNIVFLESTMFDKAFGDNKHHFLEVIKDGVPIAKGCLADYQKDENSFSLIDDNKYSGHTACDKKRVIYINNGLVIREYEYIDLDESKEN